MDLRVSAKRTMASIEKGGVGGVVANVAKRSCAAGLVYIACRSHSTVCYATQFRLLSLCAETAAKI